MANAVATAYVQVVPTTDGIQGALSDAFGKAGGPAGMAMGSGIMAAAKSFIGPLAAIFSVAAITDFAKQSVTAASDLNESANAIKVTFGDAAGAIATLGETASTRLGLSQSQFAGIATQFSAFAGTIAGQGGDIASVIDQISTRGADFASVMNLDVNEALALFQSGLAGETEPLRRYGIDLSAAAVEAYALAKGIFNGTGEMTEAQKVQARYGYLMEQTSKTQGDFANTSDGLANQQRILAARFEDVKARLGSALLPILTKLGDVILNKVLPALDPFIQEFIDFMGKNDTKFLDAILGIFKSLGGLVPIVAQAFKVVGAVFTGVLAPVLKIVAAILEPIVNLLGFILTPILWVLEQLLNGLGMAFDAMGKVWQFVYDTFIKPVWDAIWSLVSPIVEWFKTEVFDKFGTLFEKVGQVWQYVYDTYIKPVWDKLVELVSPIVDWFQTHVSEGLQKAVTWISDKWTYLWENYLKPFWDKLKTKADEVKQWFETEVAPKIQKAMEKIGPIVEAVVEKVIPALERMYVKAKPILEALMTVFKTVFKAIGIVVLTSLNAVSNSLEFAVNAMLTSMRILAPIAAAVSGKKISVPNNIDLPTLPIPELATGGVLTQGGTVLVGERGPELLNLPTGAKVTPLDKAGSKVVNYYAAPTASIDAEQELFDALKRAKVVAGW